MAKAGAKPTPSEAPSPLSKVAREILKSCSAKEAEPAMVRGFESLRIRLSWRRLEGLRPGDPTPDQAEFWHKRDARTGGDVQHSPRFPWADDLIVREVHSRHDPRRHRRLLRRCKVYGVAVLWSEVAAVFLADAQLKLPEISPAPADTVPSVDRPGTSAKPTNTKATPKKARRQSPQTERAKRYIVKNFPDGTDGITTRAIHKKLTKDPDLEKELGRIGTWGVPSTTAINRALGRRKPKT